MRSDGAHRVVIVGGGFGGVYAARSLKRAPVEVTLVDRRNFHLFQPLLYQVATGGLSPANIAAPLRRIFRRQKNVRIVLAEVVGFRPAERRVLLRDGELKYDSLILAAGSTHSYFGHDDWAQYAPGLKTVEDATAIRARILSAFEAAERETDEQRRRELMTFVIVGGGPTGVELAGALAEIARYTLKAEFRRIHPENARIILVDAGPVVLGAYPPDLSQKAEGALKRLGVAVRSETLVTELRADHVVVKCGEKSETIRAGTILWAAGVRGSPLGQRLAEATGAEADRGGRVKVAEDFTLPGHPEIFVIGDLANYDHRPGGPLPGVAPVAIQEGRYVADVIRRRLMGRPPKPFQYRDLGSLATIGRSKAVAQFGRWHFSGFIAWMLWLLVHLMKLVLFENRLLVLVQWAWNYFTFNRSARLITRAAVGEPAPLEAAPKQQATRQDA